ncbi:PREDICTED: collagen alpha-1(I) chain-like [Cercocebus atys]|uniref:collagen alpha-1(I) chain-like n=1 Tax=Cercocebus atys TaxID=9531 RepID=UPI0005F53A42|nr:PREDICTED: collagen alpha-1(I) chain-like [Cercocebus atys]
MSYSFPGSKPFEYGLRPHSVRCKALVSPSRVLGAAAAAASLAGGIPPLWGGSAGGGVGATEEIHPRRRRRRLRRGGRQRRPRAASDPRRRVPPPQVPPLAKGVLAPPSPNFPQGNLSSFGLPGLASGERTIWGLLRALRGDGDRELRASPPPPVSSSSPASFCPGPPAERPVPGGSGSWVGDAWVGRVQCVRPDRTGVPRVGKDSGARSGASQASGARARARWLGPPGVQGAGARPPGASRPRLGESSSAPRGRGPRCGAVITRERLPRAFCGRGGAGGLCAGGSSGLGAAFPAVVTPTRGGQLMGRSRTRDYPGCLEGGAGAGWGRRQVCFRRDTPPPQFLPRLSRPGCVRGRGFPCASSCTSRSVSGGREEDWGSRLLLGDVSVAGDPGCAAAPPPSPCLPLPGRAATPPFPPLPRRPRA